MSAKKPVVVYGVSGYTGRLICEYLREFNVPFIAAGRDKKRTQEVVDLIPGLDTVDHEVVEVEHTVEALTELFSGAQVVCNTVGPFIKYGPEVVEASLAAGCHYLDTTGEQDWVMDAQSRWGQGFADKGLLLSPSIAQMYTTGEIAANIALETPGIDTLDILVLWKGYPDPGVDADHLHHPQGRLVLPRAEPVRAMAAHVDVRSQRARPARARHRGPLGWHRRTRCGSRTILGSPTAKAVGGVLNREVMEGVVATVKMVEEQIKPLPLEQQEAALSEIAASVAGEMPPRENTRINTSVDSVYATGPLAKSHCVIYGNSNYKQTGLLQAYAAYSLLQQPPKRAGFASGCQAFGHRELLGVLRSFGLVMEPVVTTHG